MVDAIVHEGAAEPSARGIVSDRADHPDRCACASSSYRLVRALAAGLPADGGAEDRLARSRRTGNLDDHILVQ
jgi:hypothetical protein